MKKTPHSIPLLSFFLLCIHATLLLSQGWEKIYTEGYSGLPTSITKTADEGFFVTSWNIESDSIKDINSTILLKVDRRGKYLFDKKIPEIEVNSKIHALSNNQFAITGRGIGGNRRLLIINNLGDIIRNQTIFSHKDFQISPDTTFIPLSESPILLHQEIDSNSIALILVQPEGFTPQVWMDTLSTKSILGIDTKVRFNASVQTETGFALIGSIIHPDSAQVFLLTVDKTLSHPKITKLHRGYSYAQHVYFTSDKHFIIAGQNKAKELILTKITQEGVEEKEWSSNISEISHQQVIKSVEKNGFLYVLVSHDQSPFEDFVYKLNLQTGALIWKQPININGQVRALLPLENGLTIAGGAGIEGVSGVRPYIIQLDKTGQSLKHNIQGKVLLDSNKNCAADTTDKTLAGFLVTAINQTDTLYTHTNEQGDYAFSVRDETYTLSVTPPNTYYKNACIQQQTLSFLGSQYTAVQNFLVHPVVDCPILEVNIGAQYISHCSDENTYYVRYCNSGTSLIQQGIIEVTIDTALTYLDASIPPIDIDQNTLLFNIGDLAIGDCHTFTIQVDLACTSDILSINHKTEIESPDSELCLPIAAEVDWDSARLEVEGACVGDSISFIISNIGEDMDNSTSYVIFIDELVLREGTIQLEKGERDTFKLPDTSSYYRLEVNQTKGYPFDTKTSDDVESCTNGPSNYGYRNNYSPNDLNPFYDIDNQQNIPPFITNDKTAFPKGYGSQHFIEPQTKIDFTIRFSNEGSDTIKNVILVDSISPDMDLSTFQIKLASHDFEYELFGSGILAVNFKNIILPSKTNNDNASNGFFTYTIQPKKETPLGTRIEGRAAIYFNYRKPLFTNNIFHIIQHDFIPLTPPTPLTESIANDNKITLSLAPNPFQLATIVKTTKAYEKLKLDIYDLQGHHLNTILGSGQEILINRDNLAAGIYILNLRGDNQFIGVEKMVIIDY